MRLTADCDFRKRLPKAIVYLVAWHSALKFVLLLFLKIHHSLGRRTQGFFLYSGENKRGRKASQKIKYKYVCVCEQNFIITAYSDYFR